MFPSDKQATLLVVDGSELIRSSTSRSLTTLGYHCLTADSGESCLELLGCNKIDLLFLDCALSGKESLELLSFLRQHYPDTPVIMTSSVMSSAEEEDAFSRGAYDYLVTPVNSCRLEITLKKALAESENRYKAKLFSAVITHSPVAITITDREGHFEYVNHAFCQTTGYSFDEVKGRTPRILKSDEHAESYYKQLWESITAGKNWHGEFHNRKKNGELYWENTIIIPITDLGGNILHFISVKQDISLRKQEQEALAESERRFQELADLLPQPIFELDLQGRITYANRLGFELFGYSIDELQGGVSSLMLFAPEERERVVRNMERRLQNIPFENHEYMGLKKDGSSFPILAYTATIIRNGKPVGIRGIALDITDRKQSEDALQQLNQTLEERVQERTRELDITHRQMMLQEKLASIGQLAAGIAHELNNPINFVRINFATLKEDLADLQRVLQEHRRIAVTLEEGSFSKEELDRLRQLEESLAIERILDDMPEIFVESERGFERITTIIGSMKNFSYRHDIDEKVLFNLNQGIRDMLIIARNEYRDHADVETLFDELPPIQCNPEQICQVVLNLIINSAQAIASQPLPSRSTIRIHTWHDTRRVYCSISDDGPGIAEELQRRIFEPFFTTRDPGKGIGLGLSISYDIIVHKHGGTIEVHCPPEGGTIFTVALPMRINTEQLLAQYL